MATTILHGDCRQKLKDIPDRSIQCCVTSPPYLWLRDYGVEGQIGQEATIDEYVDTLVSVFGEVRRTLKNDGVLWLNIGDMYAQDSKHGGASGGKNYTSAAGGMVRTKRTTGLKEKDLVGLPWLLAFALRADGWYLRMDVVWEKGNAMPESVKDRPTRAHEYLFLLAKSRYYFYDADAIKEPAVDGDPTAPRGARGAVNGPNAGRRDKQAESGLRRYEGFNARWEDRDYIKAAERYGEGTSAARTPAGGGWAREYRNKRSVWHVNTVAFADAHFATFPEKLIEPCILASSRPGDTVLDPFAGSGTTLRVAERYGRNSIGIELNSSYIDLAERRTDGVQIDMASLF